VVGAEKHLTSTLSWHSASSLAWRKDLADRAGGRRAFTLVEMLIVVSILLIITVAVVAVAPRFTDDRKLSRAADGLAQWLLTAKQRALRDQIPTGLRLFPDPQHNGLITELQYIQQPDDFKGGAITVRSIPDPSGSGLYILAAQPTKDMSGNPTVDFTGGFANALNPTNNQALWPVQQGDYLEVKGIGLVRQIQLVTFDSSGASVLVLTPVAPGQVAAAVPSPANTYQVTNADQLAIGMIVQSSVAPGTFATLTAINVTAVPPFGFPQTTITLSQSLQPGAFIFLPAPPPSASGPPWTYTSSTSEYRVIRQPRVLTGETPLQLPAGVCIDPGQKYASDPNALTLFGFSANPPRPFDILFSPQGGVLQGGVLSSGGRDWTILWVRDYTKDVSYPVPDVTLPALNWPPAGQPGDQFLVVIQANTGFIAEHPVNTAPGNVTNGADSYLPYRFAMDARSSGL